MPATEVISDHLADCDVQVIQPTKQPASRTRSSKEHIPTGLPQLRFSNGFARSANFFQETSSSVGLHQLGSTPSLHCQTMIAEAVLKSSGSDDLDSPKLERKTNTPKSAKSAANSPKPLRGAICCAAGENLWWLVALYDTNYNICTVINILESSEVHSEDNKALPEKSKKRRRLKDKKQDGETAATGRQDRSSKWVYDLKKKEVSLLSSSAGGIGRRCCIFSRMTFAATTSDTSLTYGHVSHILEDFK
ncbi:hypothetical protein RHMOL_Rhmol05G0272800 [Rhododendron molle]|uniref:Uncharacterized protein n=1 Tax=Rhododendron molle TaxID=49168 RepID=A0ACC0NUY6_RHOML|nr:hypothetical protein RHMOL_Rhmol05G0272800 [Rhododendron molle]